MSRFPCPLPLAACFFAPYRAVSLLEPLLPALIRGLADPCPLLRVYLIFGFVLSNLPFVFALFVIFVGFLSISLLEFCVGCSFVAFAGLFSRFVGSMLLIYLSACYFLCLPLLPSCSMFPFEFLSLELIFHFLYFVLVNFYSFPLVLCIFAILILFFPLSDRFP